MNIQLIALDIDGTLTNDQKQITPATQDALLSVQENGTRLVLASARPLHGLLEFAELLQLKKYHGTQFYVTDPSGYKVEYECHCNRMSCTQVDNLADFLNFAPVKLLLSVDPSLLFEVQKTIALHLPPDLTVVRTAPFYLEIIPISINKGKGLSDICDRLEIPLSASAAFGDSENDIPMLKAAGWGVAMGNAEDAVKEAADTVTITNNEDGIAIALKEESQI